MSLSRLNALLGAPCTGYVSPFLMLGDPTPEVSVALAQRAVADGAAMIEVGLPYSDPCADGPAIQAACGRAFAAGVSTDRAIETLAAIHAACPDTPLNLLVYGNLVHARGYDAFCRDVAAAGASSVLVPDVPVDEGHDLAGACGAHDLGVVHLVAPVTPPERIAQMAELATGFLYLAGLQGVTGQKQASRELQGRGRMGLVQRVTAVTDRPVCLGFGLSAPEHVGEALDAGARIAVIGSHLARAIEHEWNDGRGDAAAVINGFAAALLPLLAHQRTQEQSDA